MPDCDKIKIQQNDMALVSVIVPVYNVSAYLEECIQSIREQTYKNIEIFLIDDGSTDGSGDICDRCAAEDKRILVIHRENRGVSAVRNLGLDLMHGKYVIFIDADDVIHKQYLEILYNLCMTYQCTISCCGYQDFTQTDTLKWKGLDCTQLSGKFLDRKEALAQLNQWRSKDATAMVIVCNKMYEREIWSTIRFPLNTRHEDEFVIHHVLANAARIVVTNEPLYGYRKNNTSYMGAEDLKSNLGHLALFFALTDRIEFYSKEEPDLVDGAVHHLLRESNSFYDMYLDNSTDAYKKIRKELVWKYRETFWKYWRYLGTREKIAGMLFAYLPFVYHMAARVKWLTKARE